MIDTAKLDYWKDWLGRNESALGEEPRKMDEREELYRGEVRDIEPLTPIKRCEIAQMIFNMLDKARLL